MVKKKAGRPITWTKNLDAPVAALEFYEMIASLHTNPAFEKCHIFRGASKQGIPVIRWRGAQPQPLARVIASLMGHEIGDKLCLTQGCCNPLHYQMKEVGRTSPWVGDKQRPKVIEEPTPVPEVGLAEYVEAIQYHIEEGGVTADFPSLRKAIHPDDMSDDILTAALKELNK